jgi:cytosine/adenosine deaminase-related metal-dependent hydrolase
LLVARPGAGRAACLPPSRAHAEAWLPPSGAADGAPGCAHAAAGLAQLAKESGAYVQSHISESWAEAELVRSLHPEARGDTQVFQEMGLLTAKVGAGRELRAAGCRPAAARASAVAGAVAALWRRCGGAVTALWQARALDACFRAEQRRPACCNIRGQELRQLGEAAVCRRCWSPTARHLALPRQAVLAHGTMLSDEELRQLARVGVCLAHCPLSNFFFGDQPFRCGAARQAPGAALRLPHPGCPCSAAGRRSLAQHGARARPHAARPLPRCRVKHALSLGLKVGLGTDVAGGYSPSMLSAVRSAVVNSQVVRMQRLQRSGFAGVGGPQDADELLGYSEAFHLATLGGAEALGLGRDLGSLQPGKLFDALLVDTGVAGSAFDVFPGDTLLQRFEKFINLGDDRNVVGVWVDGRRVK